MSNTVKKMSTAASNHKRRGATPAQPMKGGWVLPHGMGISIESVTSQVAEGEQDIEIPLPASTSNAVSNSPPSSVAHSPAPPATKRPRRQGRLAFKVTEHLLSPPLEQTKKGPEAKVKQEDGPPAKRTRLSLRSSTTAPVIVQPLAAATPEIMVEVETTNTPLSSRKLVTFKGVVIKESVVVKATPKIIVNAAQVLNPEYRLKLKRGPNNPYGLTPGYSPYPYRRVPTPEACEEVYKILADLHGECKPPEKMPLASLEVAGCGEVPCILDALLRTLISGNTLMARANAAIKNLAKRYGVREEGAGKGSIDWEKVRLSSHGALAEAIKIAGDGPKRSRYIKMLLDMVYEENLVLMGKDSGTATYGPGVDSDHSGNNEEPAAAKDAYHLLSLDHMHNMTKDEALAKFLTYPGIGIKTAACVTLFCLRIPCFAVDTHVHKFCCWLGWLPANADPDNCFRHGDFMVPDHLKYGLHQLFIRHDQLCYKCRKATRPGTKEWNEAPDCPLEHLLTRSKVEVASGKATKKRGKAEEESGREGEDDKPAPKTRRKRSRTSRAKAVPAPAKEDSDTESQEGEMLDEQERHMNGEDGDGGDDNYGDEGGDDDGGDSKGGGNEEGDTEFDLSNSTEEEDEHQGEGGK